MEKRSYAHRLMGMVYAFIGEVRDIIYDKGRITLDYIIKDKQANGGHKVYYAADYQADSKGGTINAYWRYADDGQMTEHYTPIHLLHPEVIIPILDAIQATIREK